MEETCTCGGDCDLCDDCMSPYCECDCDTVKSKKRNSDEDEMDW